MIRLMNDWHCLYLNQISIFTASQKSAPVAVTVISYLTEDAAQQGLFAIPCLIGKANAHDTYKGRRQSVPVPIGLPPTTQ